MHAGRMRGADANLPVYDLKKVQSRVDEDLFAERVIAGFQRHLRLSGVCWRRSVFTSWLAYLRAADGNWNSAWRWARLADT